MTTSKTLDNDSSTLIGRESSNLLGLGIFGKGRIFDIFQASGKIEQVSTVLNMCVTHGKIDGNISRPNRNSIQPHRLRFNSTDCIKNLPVSNIGKRK
jgi:hypothetical protein